jgi:hypothetical protein
MASSMDSGLGQEVAALSRYSRSMAFCINLLPLSARCPWCGSVVYEGTPVCPERLRIKTISAGFIVLFVANPSLPETGPAPGPNLLASCLYRLSRCVVNRLLRSVQKTCR